MRNMHLHDGSFNFAKFAKVESGFICSKLETESAVIINSALLPVILL